MRIALGIAAGENDVVIVLTGPAAHLLDADTDDLVDGDDIEKFRSTLKKLGIPFHVERSAILSNGDWNEEQHPIVSVSSEEIADLVSRSRRCLVF
jgi:hypothetical protein